MNESTPSGDTHTKVDEAIKCAEAIASVEIAAAARNFASNVNDIRHLIVFPYVLLYHGLYNTWRTALIAQAMVNIDYHLMKPELAETQAALDKEVERLFAEKQAEPGFKKMIDGAMHESFRKISANPPVTASLKAMRFGATILSWAAFECVAKDLWVSALNSRPLILGQGTFRALGDTSDSGLSRKHVAVGLLVRHGFDLRKVLGTALADKFDFTGLAGIRAAYEAAFGPTGLPEKIFDNPLLNRLEATRHLIAHRAGAIDDDYRRRIPTVSKDETAVEVTKPEIDEFLTNSVSSGLSLIKWMDDWLRLHPERL